MRSGLAAAALGTAGAGAGAVLGSGAERLVTPGSLGAAAFAAGGALGVGAASGALTDDEGETSAALRLDGASGGAEVGGASGVGAVAILRSVSVRTLRWGFVSAGSARAAWYVSAYVSTIAHVSALWSLGTSLMVAEVSRGASLRAIAVAEWSISTVLL